MSTPRKGYLAFPAGFVLTPEQKIRTLEEHLLQDNRTDERQKAALAADVEDTERANATLEQAWRDRQNLEGERRRAREQREREQALLGEKEWVRSGGVLRDANGRIDRPRTAEIKRIVAQEDAEQRARERWDAYEADLAKILTSSEPVTFACIPWPLVEPPNTSQDLRNPQAISEFLFETLSIEGSKTTRKERVRAALKRWHPDKLHGMLNRVPEDEREAVKDGIDSVVISLMALQDAEKTERKP